MPINSFPFYRQLDSVDCGPSCLRMISKFYGRSLSLEYIRSRSFITKDGVSLLGLSEAAEAIGLLTQGVRINWQQLRDDIPLPCIIHWNNKHFVIVSKVKRGFSKFGIERNDIVSIVDPAHGHLTYYREEFLSHWIDESGSGIALLLEPTPKFYNQNEDKTETNPITLSHLVGYLRPYRAYLFQLGLGLLVGTLLNLILPFLSQAVVDVGIGNNDTSFILMILVAQMTLNFGLTANGLIQNWISLQITSRVSIKLISGFLAKVMRLPISFFHSRGVGDILQRIGDQNRIQNFITGSLISMIFGAITLITYSIILLSYSPVILIIYVLGSAFYLIWIFLFLKRRKELDYRKFQQMSNNQDNLVELINGAQDIRMSGAETQKRWEWERIQARLFHTSLKGLHLNQNQVLGSTFIDNIKNVLISFIAATSVVDGGMTLGMMVSTQYIIGQLNAPLYQLISFIQGAQDAKISMDRLDEVYNSEEEGSQDLIKVEKGKSGTITLRNISYSYEGPKSKKVLRNLSFDIPSNKLTAIVGVSGSGKTTLLNILLGVYKPTSGEITVDGIPLTSFSPKSWRKNCGVVTQSGYIFSDTIANNISLGDETPDFNRIVHAAKMANIDEFILSLSLGFSTPIGQEGHGLSVGQKQRILIARAIYKDAGYIFLDEPTNSLDARNEGKIINNLSNIFHNRTSLVIAHRLSTIRNASQILVMDQGQIAEKGTHDELISQRGIYFNLIEKQL